MRRLGLRSDTLGNVVCGTVAANLDAESTTSGNSSASNGSGLAATTVKATVRKSANTNGTNTCRPISLVAERTFLNKVYGFSKVYSGGGEGGIRNLCG